MAKEKSKQSKAIVQVQSRALPEYWTYLLIAAAMLVFLYACFHFDMTQDDAYISFRYAANFLAGEGLVYNYGEHVEGYTNFLWVILLALFKGLLGIDYLITSRFFGVVAGGTIFYLVYLLLRHYFEKSNLTLYLTLAILLVSNLSLPYWSIASLETSAFACMALAALVAEYRKPSLTPALLIIATLLRPEGGLVFAVILINRLLSERTFPLRYFLIYVIPLIPFAAFKIWFYGSLLPNPYFAKSGVGIEYILTGLEYLWHFTSTVGVFGILFLPPLLAIRRLWERHSLLYLYVILYIIYIIWVGGDVLKVYRFFVPVVPVLYFLFVVSLVELYAVLIQNRQKVYAVVFLTASGFAATSFVLSREHINTYWFFEKNIIGKMYFMATMLKKHMNYDFSVAASTIGMVGYELLGHRVIDMLGLTDAYIARHPEEIAGITSTWKERRFNNRYLLEQNPDFILFSTGYKPSAPAERALLLHSEFRHNYYPTGFLQGSSYKVVWRRHSDVDITKDITHNDLEFVTKLSDGYYHINRTGAKKALEYFQDSRRRLGEDYSIISYMFGECYRLLNQPDSAMQHFSRAIAQDRNCWEARLKLMPMLIAAGDSLTHDYHLNYLYQESPWLFDDSYRPPNWENYD